MRIRGLHAGPNAPQAHQIVAASSPSLQQVGSSAKVIALLCPGDERAGVEAIFGEEGRAFELKAQSLSNPSPPSDTTVGCKLKGPSGLGQNLGERSPLVWKFGLEGRKRNEKGESSRGSDERLYAGGRDDSFKEDVEETSAFREEDKEGLTGRVGSDPRGSSDMDLPSISIIRGKGLIFEGICESPGAKNMEVCQPSPSQPPESSSFPSCSLESPLSSVVDSLKYVDIPVRDEEENQCALSNQLSESFTPRKSNVSSHKEDSNLLSGSQGDTEVSPLSDFLIDGMSPRKMAKVRSWNAKGLGSRNKRRVVKDFLRSENPDVVMIQETKKEKCDRRFENMWLQHPNFKENFRNWWSGFQGNGWEGHKFMRRLQYVKAKLKEWNKFSFGELNEKKKSILNDLANFDVIEQVGGLTSELLSQRASRKGELEELILREEIHWRQKARVKWVKEGDYALWLDSPFTEEEISKAIFQLDRDKAPRPDGFTIAVFQDYWDVIKEDLSLTKKISDFRPISLITSLYKIIAKVLSGRLRGVLHETIHYTQGAFVQGRQILDAVLIANEIVDERRRSGEEGVVFKIDFEKAYDYVKWDFLDHVLEKKGFSPRWRKWMSGCLSSVSYAILVNGNVKGWVKASRGLRQGDPLSPFLFTLVADVLSRMIMRAEERENVGGEEDLQTLKSLLLVFGHISRLKVNLDKSSIYGINLDQVHLSRLAEMLDCKASD
ncbi:Transposon TX1 uncharacterized 149 kDa protein [Vitis vinifera]|uniref:Transposon TX1 uncharacterized 149 kDa protein n=1 Tax=Vitis vinifera TaxID=29760 RepID=A0A438CLB8_VITVI|nr:Transposon TX1 uncharacterized 149 kDa protein [Vitis vinifera]